MATIAPVAVRSTKRPAEVTINMFTETRDFTDTIIIIRGTPITATGITTNQTITVMATTLTLGFTFLPTEPESLLDSAFDAAQAVNGKMSAIRAGETSET
jgi:hypothetical protein